MLPKKTAKKEHLISELRQDIITGEWVVIATGRAKRPHDFAVGNAEAEAGGDDPFADPETSGQEKDTLIYRTEDGDWSLRVFPNKYPAFAKGKAARELSEGPYFSMNGVGYHEVVVTRDPLKSLGLLHPMQVAETVDAYRERYLDLMNKRSVRYIQIFHNHGKSAGASIAHPHSQIMAIPVIPTDVERDIAGAERYFRAHRTNVFDTILDYERSAKKRVVFENEHMLVYCPFASRAAFEMWVVPKRNCAYFERVTDEETMAVGEALQKALGALHQGLGNPDYNFFIHTAPCDGKDYHSYRWHIEILPRTAIWAGFELSTDIEVSTIEPEEAARFLREQL